MSDDACGHSPAIHILRGEPSEEELAALIATLAALVAALAALRGVAAAGPSAPRSAWADPAHQLRTPLHRRLAQLGSGGYCVRRWSL